MSYKLLLADGHWLMRRGLRAALQDHGDLEVVGEAAGCDEVLQLAERHAPDLVLLDLRLPGGGGIAALRRIKEQLPRMKVLVLGDEGAVALVRDVLRAGCNGYVSKDGCDRELIDAVRRVRSGEIHLDAELSRQLVLSEMRREEAKESTPLRQLTERELEVFRLIGAGYTNRAAAERIRLSPKTVEKYRAAVMQKLALRSAVDLRLMALRLGVIQGAELALAEG